MALWRSIARQRWFQVALGTLAAEYLRLVHKTTRTTMEPPDGYARVDADLPVILAIWHGQHFMGPFLRRPSDRATVLVSRHRDGEINAIAADPATPAGVSTRKAALGRFRRCAMRCATTASWC
jgi:lysophospholipid acyltransferase (LPLAT)-like uncharacterized protein